MLALRMSRTKSLNCKLQLNCEKKTTCRVLSAEQLRAAGLLAILPTTSPKLEAAPLTAPGR